MTLWIILTLMAAVTAAVLTIPLVRRQEARADARAQTVAVLKDQLVDVDVQLAAGSIAPADAEGLRTEIKRRMLAAGHIPADLERPVGSRALAGVAIGLAGLVALAAAGLYASGGRPELGSMATVPGAVADAAAPAAEPEEAQAAGEVAKLVGALEAKMKANPDDPEGWRMLGWSYFQTQRFTDSVVAYGKAVALKPDGIGYQSAYGEALVQAADGNVTPAAAAAFTKAKAQDGNDARARYFLGVRKSQEGDRKGAIDDWIALLGESAGDAPWVPQLRSVIEQTAKEADIDVSARLAAIRPPATGSASVAAPPMPGLAAMAAGPAATVPPGTPAGVMPGPSASQVEGAAAMTPDARQAMIRGMVDGLAQKLKANPRDEAGWLRLMRARTVLGDGAAAAKARNDAVAAFTGDTAAQGRIRAAAGEMGITG